MDLKLVEGISSSEKDTLNFSKIIVDKDYREKWNVYNNDFIVLSKNGKILRDTLYRIGGLNEPNLKKDKYFMLLKHVEAYYNDEITTDESRKRHLEHRWCIIDSDGNEVVEFESFKNPYLIKNSVLYSVDNNFFNIKDGFFYGQSYKRMETNEFLFIHNEFDKDKSKRGVYKIKKGDGTFEFFPE